MKRLTRHVIDVTVAETIRVFIKENEDLSYLTDEQLKARTIKQLSTPKYSELIAPHFIPGMQVVARNKEVFFTPVRREDWDELTEAEVRSEVKDKPLVSVKLKED